MRLAAFVLMALLSFVSERILANSNLENQAGIQPVEMYIEAFNISNHQTNILLNNGTLWVYEDVDLFSQSNGWVVGDRVYIQYIYFQGYYLQNMSFQGNAPVKLVNSDSVGLKVAYIRSLTHNTNQTTEMILDDGTEWLVGIWNSKGTQDWQLGDRVIITPQKFVFGEDDHLILNLNRTVGEVAPSSVKAQLLHTPPKVLFEDINKREGRVWKVCISNLWQDHQFLKIELDNRTIWQCKLPKMVWQIGDPITFLTDAMQDEKFQIQNLRNQETLDAVFMKNTSKGIRSPVIQKITKNGKKVLLNDGSIWTFNFLESASQWHPGDRVIVTPIGYLTYDSSTHRLVNIDRLSKDSIPDCYSANLVR